MLFIADLPRVAMSDDKSTVSVSWSAKDMPYASLAGMDPLPKPMFRKDIERMLREQGCSPSEYDTGVFDIHASARWWREGSVWHTSSSVVFATHFGGSSLQSEPRGLWGEFSVLRDRFFNLPKILAAK